MKLSNFKFSPFLACLLGLSTPNEAFCAAKVRSRQNVKLAEKKSVTPKKVENKTDADKDIATKDVPVKKEESKEEEKKTVTKDENKDVKKDEVKAPTTKTTVTSKTAKKVAERKSKVETTKKEAPVKKEEPKKEEVKIEEPVPAIVDSKPEPVVEVAQQDVKDEKKSDENVSSEDKKVEEKVGRRSRRSRRDVEALKKDAEKSDSETKKSDSKAQLKNRKKNKISIDEESSNSEVTSIEKVADDEEPGISSAEYLEKISNLVKDYSGENIQRKDIFSKLSGKNLDCFKNTYKYYDENGNHKFKKNDIQFKNQLIRRIDLREKVNLPFFRSNKEITKYFLNGISEGKLVAFFDPFLTQKMTAELLKEQLLMPKDVEAAGDDDNTQALFFDAHDISTLEIISNWIFDKNTSDFSEDPTIIKLIIPAEKFSDTTKIQRVVCYIRYADALTYLKNISDASWIDEENEAVVLSIGEAFSMGLFDSSITFLGNRDCNNGDVVDRWGSKENDLSFASRKASDFKRKFEGSLDSI